MILAGDIGGTSTRLGTFDLRRGRLVLVEAATFTSRDRVSLDDVVREFVSSRSSSFEHACFAVAGPVAGGRVKTVESALGDRRPRLGGAPFTGERTVLPAVPVETRLRPARCLPQ